MKEWDYKLVYFNGNIVKEPTEDLKKDIKLVTDVLLMELLPKKTILVNNTVEVRFTSRKYPKPLKEIPYVPDIVHSRLKELNISIPFWWVKDFGFLQPQKQRENKYLKLDMYR